MKITNHTVDLLVEVDKRLAVNLDEIADDIVTEAKRIVPVRTGALRDSIEAEVVDNHIIVGSSLDYAPIVEANSPYLRPALEAVRDKTR